MATQRVPSSPAPQNQYFYRVANKAGSEMQLVSWAGQKITLPNTQIKKMLINGQICLDTLTLGPSGRIGKPHDVIDHRHFVEAMGKYPKLVMLSPDVFSINCMRLREIILRYLNYNEKFRRQHQWLYPQVADLCDCVDGYFQYIAQYMGGNLEERYANDAFSQFLTWYYPVWLNT